MAGIDKIYGTNEQWIELRQWLNTNKPEYIQFLYPFATESPDSCRAISNFPGKADCWLYKHCPFQWVKTAIEWQYNGAPHD